MSGIPPKIPTTQISYKPFRILALVVAVLLSAFAVWLLVINELHTGFNILGSGFDLSFAVVASMCWWFALRGNHAKSRERILFTIAGAVIVGGISFAAGFFGPMFLSKSNIGPLLGVFVTGPLGFVAGSVIGAIVGYIRTREIQN